MQEPFITFKNKADILRMTSQLLRKEQSLDNALHEIVNLQRGKVHPQETIKRSAVGSYFSAAIQQINNFIDKNDIILTAKRKTNIKRLSFKADKVLRENIVLQTVAPLDVIKLKDVPVRYSYSSYGKREFRWGYGLHKKPFNEEGNSVTVANMPPKYTQSLHNHTVSEYCLSLDSRVEGIFYPGGKKEKIYTTKQSQMLHFSATTPHTLRNPLNKYSRNITYKQSVGLTDWKPASGLNPVKIIRARLIKGHVSRISKSETHKLFALKDKYYDYNLEIIRLAKGTTYKNVHNYDQYIFVISGRLTITHKNIQKKCQKNDFIVIDKNTDYEIKAETLCRLYTIQS